MKRIILLTWFILLSGCNFITTHQQEASLVDHSKKIVFSDREIEATKTKAIIAVLLPLSGKAHSIASSISEAVQLAYNNNTNQNIIIRFYDTYGGGKACPTQAAQKAVEEGADVIVGPLYSQNVVPIYQVASDRNIPVFALSNDRSVLAGTHNLFLMGYSLEVEVERMVDYVLKTKKPQRFVAMVPHNRYGSLVLSALQSALKARGLSLVRYVVYPTDTVNFTPYVQQLIDPNELASYNQLIEQYNKDHETDGRSSSLINAEDYPILHLDFDTLFIGDVASRIVLLGVHLPYVGIDTSKINLVGTSLWGSSRLYGEGVFANAMFPVLPPLNGTIFASKYADIFKHSPNLVSAAAYDTIQLLTTLLKVDAATGKVSFDFSEESLKDVHQLGVLGNYTLRSDGIVKRDLDVMGVSKRKYVVLDEAFNSDFMQVPDYRQVELPSPFEVTTLQPGDPEAANLDQDEYSSGASASDSNKSRGVKSQEGRLPRSPQVEAESVETRAPSSLFSQDEGVDGQGSLNQTPRARVRHQDSLLPPHTEVDRQLGLSAQGSF